MVIIMSYFFDKILPNLAPEYELYKDKKSRNNSVFLRYIIAAMFLLAIGAMILLFTNQLAEMDHIQSTILQSNGQNVNRSDYLKLIVEKQKNFKNKIFPSTLDKKLEDLLTLSVSQDIEANIVPGLVVFLENSLKKDLHNKNIESLLSNFKIYLMVTGLEEFNTELLRNWYNKNLKEINALLNESQRVSLNEQFNKLHYSFFSKISPNQVLYNEIISALSSSSIAKDVHAAITRNLKDNYPLYISSVLPQNSAQIFEADFINLTIPFLYTKKGYKAYIEYQKKILADIAEISCFNHILSRNDLINAVKESGSIYSEHYLAYWNELFSSVKFKNLESLEDALSLLKKLDSDTSIITRFFQQLETEISTNTQPILEPSALLAEKAQNLPANKLTQDSLSNIYKEVEESLIYKQNSQVTSAETKGKISKNIKSLTNLVSSLIAAQNTDEAAFVAMKKTDSDNHIIKIEQDFVALAQPLDSLYGALVDNVKNIIYHHAANYVNLKWQDLVYSFYMEKLSSKYPINRNNYDHQVLPKDFTAFFAKNGIVESFYTEYLVASGMQISSQSAAFFKFAEQVKAAWFNDDGKLIVPFLLTPNSIDPGIKQISLSLLDQEILCSADKIEPASFEWKAQKGDLAHVKLLFLDKKGSKSTVYYNGLWSWYKFLALDKRQNNTSSPILITEISNNLESPLGNFEFSVSFNVKLPLLSLSSSFVPQKIIYYPGH